MGIEIVSEKENRLEFLIKGIPVPFVNLVRRYGMGQIPVFAIDKTTFYENNSSMFDEYLAHRLGQVPLISESSRAGDEVAFTLEASGPCTVYSKDLKSMDSKIKSSLDHIPLLQLLEGQNLRLEAKARRGIGRQHAKYQPGLIAYEIISPTETRMKIESFTQYEPRELLMKTADLIIGRCDELEEKLSAAKKESEE